ncbi:hypothetical protein HK102_008544 [Quaeritorhiza haematococci]|nr:hypothetical protein HK102_008544 [Quaeritorhiza haematococci]
MRTVPFFVLPPFFFALVGLWHAETVTAAGQKYYGNGYYQDKNYYNGQYSDHKDGGYGYEKGYKDGNKDGYEKYKGYKDGYGYDNKYYDDKKN